MYIILVKRVIEENIQYDGFSKKKKNTDDFFNVAELHEDKITDVAQQEGAKRYFLENKLIKRD